MVTTYNYRQLWMPSAERNMNKCYQHEQQLNISPAGPIFIFPNWRFNIMTSLSNTMLLNYDKMISNSLTVSFRPCTLNRLLYEQVPDHQLAYMPIGNLHLPSHKTPGTKYIFAHENSYFPLESDYTVTRGRDPCTTNTKTSKYNHSWSCSAP